LTAKRPIKPACAIKFSGKTVMTYDVLATSPTEIYQRNTQESPRRLDFIFVSTP
jgi:hypothetical protein